MNSSTQAVLDRTLKFSVDVIAVAARLPRNSAGREIERQVVRSGCSIGANFREAQNSRSRAEFVSKIQIALQEASETLYWLQIVEASGWDATPSVSKLLDEADQLVSILTAITRSTKSRRCATTDP